MRRFFLIPALLAALLVPVAASASPVGGTDGSFSLRNVSGTFVVVGKGAIIGQLDRGYVRIVDPTPADGSGPIVSGAEHARPLSDTTSAYSGTDVTFRMIGGTFNIRVTGQGIDISFVGRGKVTVSADATALDAGKYSVDGGDTFKTVPFASTVFAVGTP